MYGSTDTPNVADTDPTGAFNSAQLSCIHSSLLSITDRVPIQRHLGKSKVVCWAPDTGEQVIGSLHSAMRWVSQQQGWFKFTYIN